MLARVARLLIASAIANANAAGASLAIFLCCVGCTSCDREEPAHRSRPPEPAPVASVARALGVDAGELEPAVDPPPAAGDLKSEIDAFTSVDACVEQRAHVDPLLGDALDAIGYDTFVRDACRVLDAAKAKDARRCDGIDASSLRRRCQSVVAAVAGDADGCPWMIPSRPESGREAWCLTIAARDPRLCAAEDTASGRATCEATVRHDPAPCAKVAFRAEQARCRREAERWRAVTQAPDPSLAALASPAGTLHVEGLEAGAPDASLAADLERGIVLVDQRDGTRFDVGAASLGGPSFVASSPHTLARFSAEIFASSDGKRVAVDRVELSLPGRPSLATPLARSTLVAKIDKLERTRGGAVNVSLEGDLGDSTGTVHVRVEASTFVRDVVTAKALYGARAGAGTLGSALRFGDAGAMR
jgi:hypothetical protein